MTGYLVEERWAGQAQEGGGHYKGGTDFHNRLILRQISGLGVKLEIGGKEDP